ncbi:hypothetical protein MPSEU_000708500 [Mayamaea pseudoterrestris]|nr:hypothetical protein MPSEU_000708500 [Mayamaea pseudoterrestris]
MRHHGDLLFTTRTASRRTRTNPCDQIHVCGRLWTITTTMSRLKTLLLYISGTIASVPWQESRQNVVQEARYVDLPPNVFASSGRLLAVEQVVPLSALDDPSYSFVIAFHTKEGIVVVASRPKSPYLFETAKNSTTNSSVTSIDLDHGAPKTLLHKAGKIDSLPRVFDPPFAYLSQNLMAITAGNAVDSQIVRLLLQKAAESSRPSLTRLMARSFARSLADQLQQRSQQAGKGRLLASTAILMDDQELWRVDPTGQFFQCQVAVAGRAADKIHDELLKKLSNDAMMDGKYMSRRQLHDAVNDLSINECLLLAIRTIQTVFPSDKSTNTLYLTGLSTTIGSNGQPSQLVKHSHTNLMALVEGVAINA